jgi:ATP-binding cassette subfamily B protein/subfamily B ATP-binding cassette protein MsbA
MDEYQPTPLTDRVGLAWYLRRLWPYFRPYWRLALFTGLAVLLSAGLALLTPWPLKVLIDSVLGDHPVPGVFAWAGENRTGTLLAAVAASGLIIVLIEGASNVIDSLLATRLEQRMTLDLRSDLFRHAQRLSLAFHDQKRSGMLIYAVNYMAAAGAGLVMAIPPLVQSALTLLGMFVVTLLLDWKLALLSLVVIPFLYFTVRTYVRRIQPRLYAVQGMEGESLSIVHEAISMLKVIVAFGREEHEHRRFRIQGEQAVDARVRLTVRQTGFNMAVSAVTATGTALVVGLGAYHCLQGKLTIGQLTVFIAYLAAVYKPLESISYTAGSLQEKFMQLRRAFELLDTAPEIRDTPDAVDLPACRGHIAFEGVGFHYATRTDTLCDVSLEARPGEVVAIVGPTGAGKSTLVSLIPRFYDVQVGRVTIDGHDVRKVKVASLRRNISMVLQEPLLFSGTIQDNIRYGRLDATDEQVVAAARAANAHEFITALPKGYKTELGERGTQISGGERQRISVARAFLRNAPILILDEPTSSIDSRTEAVILDALDRLMAGRTTFMIAHRLSTVRRADLILVVDGGRIVQSGTHDDLLRRPGLYRQLWELQNRHRRREQELAEDAAALPGALEPAQPTDVAGGVA